MVPEHLPNLDTVYASWLRRTARNIGKDPSHIGHSLFVPLPLGKRFRAIKSWTSSLRNSSQCYGLVEEMDPGCRGYNKKSGGFPVLSKSYEALPKQLEREAGVELEEGEKDRDG
ncbi:unnamed protein product [Pleuronectes platessa]|uniref:Uncharacterized protein n=1 Tax=Pleuronectes platessa TaxID=8262 RepID=A0A9N7TNB2_PLEPL|nr:unnamed protein product [Pleuronectes platessa]